MKFTEVVDAARALLQRKQRITYRGLAREFDLDAAALRDLCEELIDAERVAIDEGGKVLVWADPAPPASLAAAHEAVPAPALTEGDRRQLTVMFCDLVGSTALSEQLDPEDLHELVGAYQQAIRQVVQALEGYVAQYLGDGILVYFGYPAAHEDDALRGVQAGLKILDDISALRTRVPVQVRIGVHTGPVVIGSVGAGLRVEQLALGKTPNIGARVQSAAPPHSLAISADTHRLVQGLLECESLGLHDLKGIAQPMQLYRVRKLRARHRFDALLEQGLMPMQGRGPEFQALQHAWQQACAGRGQALLLSGEAGIGKSRLIQALSLRSAESQATRLVFRASAFHVNSPFYPIIEQLNWAIQSAADEPPARRLSRLSQLLHSAGLPDNEHLYLMAGLLSIPMPDGLMQPVLSREERKSRTLQALSSWLLSSSAGRPVLLVFEDLHWADPSTLALLSLTLDRLQGKPMLVALTSRPEFVPPWPADARCRALPLGRLSPQDIRRMALQIAGKPLPPAVLDQLVSRTDGVPLYVEEMTKDLLESRLLRDAPDRFELAGDLPQMAVPFSLQDSLASRLDRLGPARRLAEVAVVLGREFSLTAIRALADADDDALYAHLQCLCDAGVLLRHSGEDQAVIYVFRHALMQDAAYQALLIRKRQQTHARIARLFATQWADQAARQPALAAHHCTQAGLVQEAVGFWQRAGLQAMEGSANQEAIQHVSKALEILQSLPEGAARDRQELSLLLALGVPLAVTSSWAAPKVRWASERALELCEALGESSQLFQAMFGAWSSRQVQAEYGAARLMTAQLLALARHAQDDGFALQAHRASGIICLHMGEFAQALQHCEAGWGLYDRDRHRAHIVQYWLDPGVGCLCYGAWALLHLGRADQALQQLQRAVDLAGAGGHAFSQAYALFFCAVLHHTRREPGATRERALAFLALAQTHGFQVLAAWATLFLGWSQHEEGQAQQGCQMIREGEQATRAGGARVSRSGALAVLAAAYLRTGEVAQGLATVAEALDFVAQSDEHFYAAELHRLRGELLLLSGTQGPAAPALQAQALDCFAQCLAIADRQGARLWALRGTTSQARLLLLRGDPGAAQAALSAALSRVAEGLATRDVQEAQALLLSLGAPALA